MKKFFKLFVVYSYITLVCYVGSENALTVAKARSETKNDNKQELKIESLWKTTFKRFKEAFEIVMKD